MVLPNLRTVYAKAFESWSQDHGPRLAAAIAFYAMLSLSPLLVLAVAIAGRVLGETTVRSRLLQEATTNLGYQASEFLGTLIEATASTSAGVVATIISLAIAIYGATNLFGQLAESVDVIWNIRYPRRGFRVFLLGKLAGLIMFLAFATVFLCWLGLDAWLGWIGRHVGGFQGWQFVSLLVSVLFLTLVFAVSFRALPRGMVAWGDVWYAALTTAVGFAISKFLLSLYFAYSGVSAAYGSAGALVVVLLWIYYSAQIYFFGIELTCTYAHTYGSQCERTKGEEPELQP